MSTRRSLLRLPNELLYQVGALLIDDPDLNAGLSALASLSGTCRLFQNIYEQYLYQSDARSNASYAVVWGAGNGRMGTLEKAVRQGADVREGHIRLPGFIGKGTALHYAALKGFDDIVEFLLAHGAEALSREGRDLCSCHEEHRTAPMVLNVQPPFRLFLWQNVSPLHLAICSGNTSTARLLIDLDSQGYANNADFFEKTTNMMLASACGLHCLFDALLDGENAETFVQRVDDDRNSMFHFAAGYRSSPETILALANLGCDRSSLFNDHHESPLGIAVTHGRWDSALTILNMGGGCFINRHQRDNFCWEEEILTALIKYDSQAGDGDFGHSRAAAQWKADTMMFMRKLVRNGPRPINPKRLKYLLSRAMFNFLDGEVEFRNPDKVIKMILELGADPNAKDLDGDTILHFVLLPDRGEDVEHDDPEVQLDKEMSHLADIHRKHGGVIQHLLEHGASLAIKNAGGQTHIEYLVNRYNPRRLDPSAPGNPAHRFLVLTCVRQMLESARPPPELPRTRAKDALEKEMARWRA